MDNLLSGHLMRHHYIVSVRHASLCRTTARADNIWDAFWKYLSVQHCHTDVLLMHFWPCLSVSSYIIMMFLATEVPQSGCFSFIAPSSVGRKVDENRRREAVSEILEPLWAAPVVMTHSESLSSCILVTLMLSQTVTEPLDSARVLYVFSCSRMTCCL